MTHYICTGYLTNKALRIVRAFVARVDVDHRDDYAIRQHDRNFDLPIERWLAPGWRARLHRAVLGG